MAMLVLSGDLALAGKPALPQVRYRIHYIQPVPDATFDLGSAKGMNNAGKVVGVLFFPDAPCHAFFCDPNIDSVAIDLNQWFQEADGVPFGYFLATAQDISDHNVIVGELAVECGPPRGFAIDLAAETPVVDLLPVIESTCSRPIQINENGDILIIYQDCSGEETAFLFNPGVYGADPHVRELRDGLPLDFSDDVDSLQLLPTGESPRTFQLNNPFQGRPAQVLGTTVEGLPFRYTTIDDDHPEGQYEEFDLQVLSATAINDEGAFCGRSQIPLNKKKYKTEPYRYYEGDAGPIFEVLPTRYQNDKTAYDINNQRDMVTTCMVYLDDWRDWIELDDLVVGTSEDVARWFELDAGFLRSPMLGNRISVSNGTSTTEAGIIVALQIGAGFTWDQREVVVLIPEPVE